MWWVAPSLGIRKRYGKCTLANQNLALTVYEFSAIRGSSEHPQEDKQDVVYVLEVPKGGGALQTGPPASHVLSSPPSARGSAVVAVQARSNQKHFISFQQKQHRDEGISIEMGAIVKQGSGVKLESTAGDFAEWHRRADGEQPHEEGDVVGFDRRGEISRRTRGARMLGVVSRRAMVEGSAPPHAFRENYETVA